MAGLLQLAPAAGGAQRRGAGWLRRAPEPYITLPLACLLVIVVIWGAALHLMDSELRSARAGIGDSVNEQMDTYEAQIARNLGTIEQTMKVTRYTVGLKGARHALDELGAQGLLPSSLVFAVAIADRDGNIVASNPAAAPRSLAPHGYFQVQRQRRSDSMFVGPPVADQPGGPAMLHFTRRLDDAAGNFDGVVLVEVDPNYFTSGYERAREGELGLIGLFGRDGSPRALRVGERTSWSPPPQQAEVVAERPFDGVARLTATRALPAVNMVAVVGLAIPEQLADYAEHRRALLWQAGVATCALMLFGAFGSAWSWQRAVLQRSTRQAQETYAAASEANLDAFFVLHSVRDGAGQIVDFSIAATNTRAEQMQGMSKQQLLGRRISDMLPRMHESGKFARLVEVMEQRSVFQEEWENLDQPHVKARWLHQQLVGVEAGVVAIVRDVSERRLAEERILYLAQHDVLTGLPNRALTAAALERAIVAAELGRDRAVLVAFIDLDGFKLVNDSLGHAAGDELLQQVTRRMQACVRADDIVGRFGGDEFVLVMPWPLHQLEAAELLLDKIRAGIAQPLQIAGQEVRVSASIGVAVYPRDGDSAEAVMLNADLAMYGAKDAGKNNFLFFHPQMNDGADAKLSLLEAMRQGLAQEQFRVVYQPKVDLRSGQVFGVEALVRWQHPEMGLISPQRFIPLAEESGLIVELGEWVLRSACAQNAAWRRAGLAPISVAVNVSARQFDDKEFVAKVARALADCGLPVDGLELEVTESLIMRNLARGIEKMAALKATGLTLSIDDFGIGYSSLSALKNYPISRVKIDQSFVRDLAHGKDDQAIARAIIALAHQLNLRVLAEGVETPAQRDFLIANGCDEMQGYLYSLPLPGEQIPEVLARPALAALS